mgnify:CR=1 FL=1
MNELAQGWISTEDRLPEEQETVLCYCPELRLYICMGEYRNNHWYRPNGWKTALYVTHWMPLPTPPKENSDV